MGSVEFCSADTVLKWGLQRWLCAASQVGKRRPGGDTGPASPAKPTAVWDLAVAKFELWFAGAAGLMALVLDGERK